MLQFFRRIINSRLGLVIAFGVLGVIALAFAAGDVTGLASGGGGILGNPAVKVGGQSVSSAELARRAQDELRLARQQQPTYDMSTLIAQGGVEAIVQRAISTLALDEFGHDQGLRVSRALMNDSSADEQVRVAIVGGGATGVELAAELYNAAGALRHYGLEVFDESRMHVTLLEAGPRILPALPEKLAAAAKHELEVLGVQVRPGVQVVEARPRQLVTKTGEVIEADLIVWAAGVKGADFLGGLGLETNGRNQILVTDTLQTREDPCIYALGDCASYTPPGEDRPVPPRAQAAHQMAETVFTNIVRMQQGRPLTHFVYRDKGSLVSLSRFSTVGSLMGNLIGGSMAIEGRLARFIYTSLYRLHLIGIHGWVKATFLMLVGRVNRIVRPKLKLH